MCFINFNPCCQPFIWLYATYLVPAMSPGTDMDALQLSDEHQFPQLESGRVSRDDKFQKSEKLVEDAKNTATCLMYFNSFVAILTMLCAMFSFGTTAMNDDVDGAFISFYIMVFCFFLLVFETRRLIFRGKAMTEEEQVHEERKLATGIIDEFKLKDLKFYTKHRYMFGFMYDSNLRVIFMFFVALECFALGKIGMICGTIFLVATLVNAFIRCTRPRLYENLSEPRPEYRVPAILLVNAGFPTKPVQAQPVGTPAASF